MSRPQLSCVVPVFNEAANVAPLADRLGAVLAELVPDWELVLVDDGSSDDSWREITALSRQLTNLSAVRLTRNFGKEAAIYAGLLYARGESVVVLDGDMQHPPELIQAMWQLYQDKTGERPEVVSAVKSRRQRESISRGLGARLFYWLFKRSSGIDLESTTDFKLISGRVRELYLSLPEQYRFFRGLTRWFGFPEKTVEFAPPERPQAGGSRWNHPGLFRYAIRSLISFSSLPIRLLGWLGALTLLFAFLLGLQTLINKLTGTAVEGFTTVILTLLIIGSILMIGLSIIGGYISEIFHQVRQRPSFVVREQFSPEQSEPPQP